MNNLLISRSSSKKKSKDKSDSEKEKPKLEKIQVRVQHAEKLSDHEKRTARRTLIKSVNHEKIEKIEKVTIEVKTEAREVQEVIPKVVPEEPKKIEERTEDMKTEENPFPRKGSVRSKERRKEILKSIGKSVRCC